MITRAHTKSKAVQTDWKMLNFTTEINGFITLVRNGFDLYKYLISS